MGQNQVTKRAERTHSPSELPKCGDENAVEPSWMMVQARRDMDVPSEPLGNFYWSMRINNFVGAARTLYKRNGQEGEAVVPLLPVCELEAHDLYQAELD